MMKTVKKIAGILAAILLWAVILAAALFAFTTIATRDADKVAHIAGYTPMTVRSDSMAPEFRQGDMIIVKKCDPSRLQVGDVVCFHTILENQYVINTHRIAAIEENNGSRSYVTKGDNNPVSDQHMISDNDIVGKYVGKLRGMGRVMDFLSGSVGFLLVIVLPLLVFFVYQVYHLIMVSISLKRATALEAAQERAAREAAAADAAQAEAKRDRDEIEKARREAAAALAEAKRLQAEAQAQLDRAKKESGEQ